MKNTKIKTEEPKRQTGREREREKYRVKRERENTTHRQR